MPPSTSQPEAMPRYTLVQDEAAWRACLDVLRGQPRLALDLEANSLHAYREEICLVQISVPGHDFIVDPLAEISFEALGALLAAPEIEKVFHASEYDLILLKRMKDWDVLNLFDTMWAGRVLGYQQMGLAWFLDHFYGVAMSKKYQKMNWKRRPLEENALIYAQTDTHYLLRMRDQLEEQLREAGQLEEAREIFANECRVRLPNRDFDPDGFWKLKGARKLPPRAKAILKALFCLRDELAAQRDVPPFKVMNNQALFNIACAAPETPAELGRAHHVSPKLVRSLGGRLLAVVRESKDGPAPRPPRPKCAVEPPVRDRYDKLVEWRKRMAQARGVSSDVIVSRDTLWEIARRNPASLKEVAEIPTIGPRRLALHGEAILDALA